MLQYITNTRCELSVVDQVKAVLEGGCRWIQIRMKDASDDEVRRVVEEVKPLCREKEAFLILNDRVELAKELEVDGVHLGKSDMAPSQARVLLGAAAIIGVTVNTYTDIELVRALDIDYFGVGPFRHTETKANLAPVLGLEGYREIVDRLRTDEIEIPAVAIGGITLDDVKPLMETGVNGIAVSGAIAFAPDPAEATRRFINAIGQP